MKQHSALLLLLSLLAVNAYAVPINLGTASTFGLLAGSGITNSGSSVINGDVGSSPTPAVTGFPPGIVTPPHVLYTAANAVTAQAQIDADVAYDAAAGAAPTGTLTGIDLGTFNAGNPLGPGVYFFATTAGLTGNLTLDAHGNPNAQWIFQIGSSLTTATNATVSFINGASPCNVFWQVGISATIQTNNSFGGTIMAHSSITLNGGTLNGRAIALHGAVTVSSAEFVNTACPTPAVPCVTVAKTADRSVASVGDVITYTYAVCNCGLGSLTVNSVVDSQLGNLTADFITANGGASLAAGVCTSFSKSHTVLATDPSPLVNTVTVKASSGGVDVTDTTQASVIITAPGPCVTLLKTANRTTASVGDFITYTYKVCNCGTSPLTVNSVVDTRLGDLTADFIAANGGTAILGTGLCTSFDEAYKVLITDQSPLTNGATVTASSLGRAPVTGSGQASVIINAPVPCVTVVKKADRVVAAPGDVIAYTYTVCNCGPTTLTVNSLIDTKLGDLIAELMAANGDSAILEVGACATFSENYTVLPSDASPLVNSVTVSANSGAVVVTDTAQVSVSIPLGRRCFQPVTLAQQDWHNFCGTAPGVPGGLIFNVFPSAFAKYGFYGNLYTNQAIIGAPASIAPVGNHSITFTGTTMGLTQLCNFLPQIGPADRLWAIFINPSYLLSKTGAKTSNVLAGEVLALTLNIAYNDMRLMPRSKGYDLEKFVLTQGVLKGKTVGQVWNIANAVLTGSPTCTFGLANTAALVDILKRINANYEFVDINTFIDNGYLLPNVPLGQPGPPHPMIVPF